MSFTHLVLFSRYAVQLEVRREGDAARIEKVRQSREGGKEQTEKGDLEQRLSSLSF